MQATDADRAASALIASLQPEPGQLQAAQAHLAAYFAPLQQGKGPPTGPLARRLARPLVALIKQVFALLGHSTTAQVVEALSSLAVLALDGLSAIRATLKGRPYESEVQRYTLVKRLAALQHQGEAGRHAALLLASICSHWSAQPSAGSSCATAAAEPSISGLDQSDAEPEQAAILLGAVAQLLASCAAGLAAEVADSLPGLLPFVREALSWLRCGFGC